MGWTTPRTWVDGEVETASILNAHIRDNLNAVVPNGPDAWTSYTPTLTQSGAVTKTVTYAKYMKVGRLVVVNLLLSCTGSGTAGNAVKIGLPVAAAVSSAVPIGTGYINDSSANLIYYGLADFASSTTEVQLLVIQQGSAAAVLGAGSFTAALATGDGVGLYVMYESAT